MLSSYGCEVGPQMAIFEPKNFLCTAIRSNCAFITSYVRGSPSLLF